MSCLIVCRKFVFVSIAAVTFLVPAGVAGRELGLVEAVKRQDLELVKALLAQAVDVNVAEADGATALHWATHWNDLRTATLLILAGADVNAKNELGVAPLSLAALNGNAAMATALLNAGGDPNAALPGGETILMTGSRTGSAELVRVLLTEGSEVNETAHWQKQTALMWAASEGHGDIVQLLLDNGADVHARSKHGSTPLLLAARKGDVGSARLLLAAGADVNATEPLLAPDERVDVDDFQTSRRSPLLVASASMVATSGFEYRLVIEPSGHEEFAMFLLEQGADPSTPDSIGRTPLHAAVETGKRKLVQALVAHGADLNARLVDAPLPFRGDFVGYRRYVGATPVWLGAAARVPDVDILRDLVSAGADPNLSADDRTTPLMAAVGMVQNEARLAPESESLAVVRLLVELGVDVNATSLDGQTAMHGAARLARNSVISVLVEHGGQVNTADARGRTPLDVGTVSRPLQPDTAELLKSLGGYSGLEQSNQR